MLILHDKIAYSEFLISLYMARKLFGVSDQAIKYATCKKCCKLYAIKDLPTDEPYHYTYQDFPNYPMANLKSPCNAIITKQVTINQYRPSLQLFFQSLISNFNYNDCIIKKVLKNFIGSGQFDPIIIRSYQIYTIEEFGKISKIQQITKRFSDTKYRIVI